MGLGSGLGGGWFSLISLSQLLRLECVCLAFAGSYPCWLLEASTARFKRESHDLGGLLFPIRLRYHFAESVRQLRSVKMREGDRERAGKRERGE